MGGGESFKWKKNGSRNKKSSKTKTEIRAENWRENKVNLPTMVSTGTEKKIPLVQHPTRIVHWWVSASLKLWVHQTAWEQQNT